MPGWWITNDPVDLGDLSLYVNWALLIPRTVHSSYSVLEKAIIKNRNINGDILSPCFTPTLKFMDVSTFPMMSLTKLLLNMRLIAERSIRSVPY